MLSESHHVHLNPLTIVVTINRTVSVKKTRFENSKRAFSNKSDYNFLVADGARGRCLINKTLSYDFIHVFNYPLINILTSMSIAQRNKKCQVAANHKFTKFNKLLINNNNNNK